MDGAAKMSGRNKRCLTLLQGKPLVVVYNSCAYHDLAKVLKKGYNISS